jgi:deoxycytidylate deaminase
MTMAYTMAMRSTDPNTHVGSIIVDKDNVLLATGYNGYPRGITFTENDERFQRPLKYLWMVHGEENAMANASRKGVSLKDARLYVVWLPCARCARQVVQSGISEVVYHKEGQEAYNKVLGINNAWTDDNENAVRMFAEGGVVLRAWSGDLLVPAGYYGDTNVGNPREYVENNG